MAIMNRKPTSIVQGAGDIPEDQLLRRDEIYKTATINTHVTAPDSMVAYLDGMPWTVTYFSQLIDQDDSIREVDVKSISSNQQYRKINRLELRVQSPIDFSYDSDKNIGEVKGSAIIPFIVPNIHDYFLAEAGINQMAIFRITGRERKTYHNKSVYFIEYSLEGYVSSKQDIYDALISRSVQTFYFVKDRVVQGMDPLLSPKQFGDSIFLNETLKQLVRSYFTTFLDPKQDLVFYPSTQYYIYDSRLIEFILSIVTSEDYPKLRNLNTISDDHDPCLNHTCLFSVLHSRNIHDLADGYNQVIKMSRTMMNRNSFLRSMICWSVDYYVYPKVSQSEVRPGRATLEQYPNLPITYDPAYLWTMTGGSEILPPMNAVDASGEAFTGKAELEDPTKYPNNLIDIGGENHLLIKSVHCDDYYIFSQAFYEQTGELSALEILIRDYINKQSIDVGILVALIENQKTWPYIEKFYYTPMLILLIKEAVRGFY